MDKLKLVADVSLAEIKDVLSGFERGSLEPLKISVLRNIMMEPARPYYEYLGLLCGLNVEVMYGEYDNIFMEGAGGREDLLNENTDCVGVFACLADMSPLISNSFASLNADEVEKEIHRIGEFINAVVNGIRKQTGAMILWHGFERPLHPSMGVLDYSMPGGQSVSVDFLNDGLKRSLRNIQNAYYVSMDDIKASLGAERFYDRRMWSMGKIPYSREGLMTIACEDFRFIRALKGKNKKLLVLDCDNTLWGGVIGEDGIGGIKIGQTFPGSTFYEFQQVALDLYNRGVILALCSKNNEDDVWEVFRNHPDMVLTEEHVSAHRINWEDKPSNIRGIAEELNIGLDSIVYADDSEFEVNFVSRLLPEVQTVLLPAARPADYSVALLSGGLFDTLTVSAEDKGRGRMYKAEADRKKLQSEIGDVGEYLKSLEMEVSVLPADKVTIPRIAQLTQKTNQFNLTTKRYSETDIQRFADSDESDVLCLRLQDRFSDYGIIGAAIIVCSGQEAQIDTFLLSCRALGRGVEDVFLNACLDRCRSRDARTVGGKYIQTRKNMQVSGFYRRKGFEELSSNGSETSYRLEMNNAQREVSGHFKSVIVEL